MNAAPNDLPPAAAAAALALLDALGDGHELQITYLGRQRWTVSTPSVHLAATHSGGEHPPGSPPDEEVARHLAALSGHPLYLADPDGSDAVGWPALLAWPHHVEAAYNAAKRQGLSPAEVEYARTLYRHLTALHQGRP